jgi:hypothetical protein
MNQPVRRKNGRGRNGGRINWNVTGIFCGKLLRCPAATLLDARQGRLWKVPQAFRAERLAIRPTSNEDQYGVFFAAHQVATINLTAGKSVGDVSEQVSAMSPD